MSKWASAIPQPRSRFLKIKCPNCGKELIVFDYASSVVKCDVCDTLLVEPTGGKAKIHGKILEVLE